MTQEDKKLLLKDLSARLPSGTICEDIYGNSGLLLNLVPELNSVDLKISELGSTWTTDIDNIKPYLRPMSSMTEEEVQEIRDRLNSISIGRTITKENFEKCCDFLWFTKMSPFECVSEKMMDVVIDYLDENMFDHRGLIEKGLAIKAQKMLYICNQEKRTS